MTAGERVRRIVVGVVRQALADSGAGALILLDDGSPEARLARAWCGEAAGERLVAVEGGEGGWLVQLRPGDPRYAPTVGVLLEEEQLRFKARLEAASLPLGALLAHPANKTTLLLSPLTPPEPLLPLGDLYATDVRSLAGEFSVAAPVRRLAERAGGIDALDAALRRHFDERRRLEEALAPLPEAAREPLADALAAARFARRRVGIVPKLGARTLGVDLFA